MVLFQPASRRLGLVVLVASFLLPMGGLGVDLCWFHRSVGLPCPGCGITRSVIALSHGHWLEAIRYNPFGPLVWALAWLSAALELGGPHLRTGVERWIAARERVAWRTYVVIISLFLVYGLTRLASAALGLGLLPVPT